MIENLDCTAELTSGHIYNLLQEVDVKLPGDKQKLLDVVTQFQSMPAPDRLHFTVGRRLGKYTSVNEMQDPDKHQRVEEIMAQLRLSNGEIDDDLIHELRLRFS
jgi:hypothetical protein